MLDHLRLIQRVVPPTPPTHYGILLAGHTAAIAIHFLAVRVYLHHSPHRADDGYALLPLGGVSLFTTVPPLPLDYNRATTRW